MNWHELEQAALKDGADSHLLGPQQPHLKELLRSPQAIIPTLVADYRAPWRVPIVGFIALSYTEGWQRVATNYPDWPVLGVLAVSLVVAGLFGGWLWAFAWGGATHLAARSVGGKKFWSETARAVGYGLFWPGISAAIAGTALALTVSSPV